MVVARDSIALAADVPLAEALTVYETVSAHVGVVKVGLSLFVEHGPRAVEAFRASGAEVFLDLKLHDIPNTVELAAARAAALGVAYLTVHAGGGAAMLRAAMKGAQAGAAQAKVKCPTVLAVTVLTSIDEAELRGVGVNDAPAAQALRLALLAREAGVTGLVCSAQEAAQLRKVVGPSMVLCTPGIRPAGAAKGDQARVETPADAVKAGADLLVVGRPIYAAADPVAAARAICDEIASASAAR